MSERKRTLEDLNAAVKNLLGIRLTRESIRNAEATMTVILRACLAAEGSAGVAILEHQPRVVITWTGSDKAPLVYLVNPLGFSPRGVVLASVLPHSANEAIFSIRVGKAHCSFEVIQRALDHPECLWDLLAIVAENEDDE